MRYSGILKHSSQGHRTRRQALPPAAVDRKCIGQGCNFMHGPQQPPLDCGHFVCTDCRHSSFINNQDDDRIMRFYQVRTNFYGRNIPTSPTDLDPASPCPLKCAIAGQIRSIPRTPKCPPHVEELIVWDEMKARVGGLNAALPNDDPRLALSVVLPPDPTFLQPKHVTGCEPISRENTLYLFPEGTVNRDNIDDNALEGRVFLIRVRPSNHSPHALYVWISVDRLVSHLVEAMYYIIWGHVMPNSWGLEPTMSMFLYSADTNQALAWSRTLDEVLRPGEGLPRDHTMRTRKEW